MSASAKPNVVLQSDLRPTDVLLGRGRTIQSYPGNVRLRSIVATRRVEYNSINKNADKKRIAGEVVDLIVRGGSGCAGSDTTYSSGDDGAAGAVSLAEILPGRFLRAATQAEADALRQSGAVPLPSSHASTGDSNKGEGTTCIWVDAEMDVVLDKVKQLLRAGASKIQVEHLSRLSEEAREKRLAKERAKAERRQKKQQQKHNNDAVTSDTSTDMSRRIANMKRSAPAVGISGTASSHAVATTDEGDDSVLRQLFDMFDNDGSLPESSENGIANDGEGAAAANTASDANDLNQLPLDLIQALQSLDPEADDDDHGKIENSSVQQMTSASVGSAKKDARLNNNITIALETARTLSQKHRTAAAANALESATVQADLYNLGTVFYKFFTGVDSPSINSDRYMSSKKATDSDEEDEYATQRRRKRPTGETVQPSRSIQFDALVESGLPVPLCILITSLLDATDSSAPDRFVSASDVEDDLSGMLSNSDTYLLDPFPEQSSGTLLIDNNKLYGRDEHFGKLRACFDSVITNASTERAFVSISGNPGTGKSSLVESLAAPLAAKRGMFLSIKFDQQSQNLPIARIFDAVDEYCRNLILINDSNTLVEVGRAVSAALGPAAAVLKDIIPSLGFVLGSWPLDPPSCGQADTHVLVMHCIRSLVQAIAAPNHPLVVVIDDTQWADAASLELLSTLIMHGGMQSAIFIACFRPQEVNADHPWTQNLNKIMSTGIQTTSIELGTLPKESINDLLSDILHLPPRLTRQFADVLHAKTGGNPLFAKQLLRSLCDEGLLQYSAVARRWAWDIETIRSKDIADNAIDHMISVMANYGAEVKWTLSMAACLGVFFDLNVLQILYKSRFNSIQGCDDEGDSIDSIMDTLVSSGTIIAADLSSESQCKFAHQTLWQAAYELTPVSKRNETHLNIGRQLLRANEIGSDTYLLYIVVDQVNRGVRFVANDEERLTIVELNLNAGEKCLSEFSFQRASTYLLQACSLVHPSDWEVSYEMCLRLFNSGSEIQLILGDFKSALRLLQPIKLHGRCLRDKIQAIHGLIMMKFSQGNAKDALKDCLNVLEQLAESFPQQAEQKDIKIEIGKTHAMIASNASQGIEGILSMKLIEDQNQHASMKMLLTAARIAKIADQKLMVLLCLRMVQKSMKEGLSTSSGFAFASCSFIFCGLGMLPMSNTCYSIASCLLSRFEGQSPYMEVASTKVPLLMSIKAFLQPMQSTIAEFRAVYTNPLAVRDVRFAPTFQVTNAIIFAPEPGKTLKDIEAEIRCNAKDAKENKHVSAAASLVCLQTVLNLRGSGDVIVDAMADPSILSGEVMNQENLLIQFKDKNLMEFVRKIYFYRMYLAYLFRRHATAAEMAQEYQTLAAPSPFNPTYEVMPATLYLGLIATEMLWHQQRRRGDGNEDASKWRAIASTCLDKLKKWNDFGNEVGSTWNVSHKYDLLRAELAVLDGNIEEAMSAYISAIQKAKEHYYVNEEALASERSGIFHWKIRGDAQKGREDLTNAAELYRKWGARRKAVDVAQLLSQFE